MPVIIKSGLAKDPFIVFNVLSYIILKNSINTKGKITILLIFSLWHCISAITSIGVR